MEELKTKWCVDLEDILQCPVCFERPVKPIYQCKEGHHICSFCRLQIHLCPLCQGAYNGSRSFLAEHLALKLDEIKCSLMLPPKEQKNESVGTQTEKETKTETKSQIRLNRPLAAKGKFPCRIGKCRFEDAYSRILNHLRYHHKDRLLESSSLDGKVYSRHWEIDHLSNIEFDLAFFIPEMGIFFLITSIDSCGNFIGNIQIVNNNTNARQFTYKIEIKGNNRTGCYENFPRSCRTLPDISYTKSLHISSQDMRRMVNNNNKVICTITITHEEVETPNNPHQETE